MTTDEMCIEARKAIAVHINRSAGQNLRAMRESSYANAPTEGDLYAMAMESETAYRFGQWLCKQAGVSYPPTNKG